MVNPAIGKTGASPYTYLSASGTITPMMSFLQQSTGEIDNLKSSFDGSVFNQPVKSSLLEDGNAATLVSNQSKIDSGVFSKAPSSTPLLKSMDDTSSVLNDNQKKIDSGVFSKSAKSSLLNDGNAETLASFQKMIDSKSSGSSAGGSLSLNDGTDQILNANQKTLTGMGMSVEKAKASGATPPSTSGGSSSGTSSGASA